MLTPRFPTNCKHPYKVRAQDVSMAIAPDGHLAGEERAKYYGVHPLPYAVVEFCGNPGCEKVFKVEREGRKRAV